jgi:hypothetical protein
MVNAEAPYCDSCGCTVPLVRLPLDIKAFIGGLGVASIVIVAFAFFRSFAG